MISEFKASAIIELLGANNEYIRVIDNVRDYIMRQRLSLSDQFKKKLSDHVDIFLKKYENYDNDLSDYLYSLKSALLNGRIVNERYLIPSHFLKKIKELYDQRHKFQEVINLSDKVLASNKQNFDNRFLQNIRYYLCLALARMKDQRCLDEVYHFSGAEHNFLLGFYYRQKGRYKDAIERLSKSLDDYPLFARARRELVLVLSYIGEFDKASELARLNFENDRSNPYHVQAYINCLLKNVTVNREKILDLLSILENIPSKVAREMWLTSKAEFVSFHDDNIKLAIELINEAKSIQPDSIYPYLMEFDIYARCGDIHNMEASLSELRRKNIDQLSSHYNSLSKRECIYISMTHGYNEALDMINKYCYNYTESAKERFKNTLIRCSHEKYIEYAC